MVAITFPLIGTADDVTVDSVNITSMDRAGMLTLVQMKDGHFYRSTAPLELFEITIASGGGNVVPTSPNTTVLRG